MIEGIGEPVTRQESLATLAAAMQEAEKAVREGDIDTALLALEEGRRRLRIVGIAFWHQWKSEQSAPAWPCRCPWCMTENEVREFYAEKEELYGRPFHAPDWEHLLPDEEREQRLVAALGGPRDIPEDLTRAFRDWIEKVAGGEE